MRNTWSPRWLPVGSSLRLATAALLVWVGGNWVSDLTDFHNTGYAAMYIPVAGIASLLVRRPRFWPSITLGAVLGNLGIAAVYYGTFLSPLLEVLVNCSEAAVVAALILRWRASSFTRPRDAFALTGAAALGSLWGASIGAPLFHLLLGKDLPSLWQNWFTADFMGMVFIIPLAVTGLASRPSARHAFQFIGILTVSTALASAALVWGDTSAHGADLFLVFLPWYGLLLVMLLSGITFGAFGLGLTQIPAALATFAASPVRSLDDWLARQTLSIGLAVSLLVAVLAVRRETARRAASEALARDLFDRTPVATARLEPAGAPALGHRYSMSAANPALLQLLGITREQVSHTDLERFVHPDDITIMQELLDGDVAHCELRMRPRGLSDDRFVRITTEPVAIPDHELPDLIIVMRDVTEQRLAEAQLRHQARIDSLTGALNRGAFVQELDAMLQAGSELDHIGLVFIDLDDFKVINDKYGHVIGDAALAECADRIRDVVRPRDILGRYGGDEFVVALGVHDEGELQALCTRIEDRLCGSLDTPIGAVPLGASAGCAIVDDRDDLDQALRRADERMYARKAERKASA